MIVMMVVVDKNIYPGHIRIAQEMRVIEPLELRRMLEIRQKKFMEASASVCK